jgi:hypothetical protein
MFTIGIVVWSIIVAAIVSRYPKFFKNITAYRINLDSSDSEPDDDMVGHYSLSETEKMENTPRSDSDSDSESDHLDSDSEFDPDEETQQDDVITAAKVLVLLGTDEYDKLPEYMKDFYEETTHCHPNEWMALTDDTLARGVRCRFIEQKRENSKTC